jgi:dolichyl-phosphate-mannose--protein O-mannosyl transferase
VRAGFGPGLGLRPLRILAGLLLGLAVGTKWSALWFIAAFGLLSVAWDASARRRAGVRLWWQGTLVRDALPAFASIVGVAAVTYVASWTSWFTHQGGYGRQWASGQPDSWVPEAVRSWWHYHAQMWEFHNGLHSEHPYTANPFGWLLQLRPTSFFYESPEPAGQLCGADRCAQAITSLGNPFIWWFGTAALVAAIWWAVRRRDGVAAALVVAVLAGWVPWLMYADRPIFTFYAIALLPFLVLTLTWAVGRLYAWAQPDEFRRRWLMTALVVAAVLVVGTSIFFYPLWTAQVTSFRFWQLHMWLPSWV